MKELAKFTVQHPGASITKQQPPFISTKVYELSCKMETVKLSFWVTGIWLTDRMNIDNNLFNPSKAYQSLEATNNFENDVVNSNVESEADVKNQLLHSTNLKKLWTALHYLMTTKSKLKVIHKIFCTKFHISKVNCWLFAVLQPSNCFLQSNFLLKVIPS